MALPKKKTSRTRRDKRGSHLALREPNLSVCPKCGALMMPHRVCKSCGTYKKRELIVKKEKSS